MIGAVVTIALVIFILVAFYFMTEAWIDEQERIEHEMKSKNEDDSGSYERG